MINEKAKEELTPRDLTLLEDITKKGKFGITTAERELLVARRGYLTEAALGQFEIDGPEIKEPEVNSGDADVKLKYSDLKFAQLKKEAKERGIVIKNNDKAVDIIALLEKFDSLQDGDEFQGQIAKIATQEMIDDSDLGEDVKVGDLVFVEKE